MRAAPASLLLLVLASCGETRGAQATEGERTFRFVIRAALRDVPEGSEQARLWVPVPENTPEQTIGSFEVDADADYVLRAIRGGSGATLCFESAGEPIQAIVAFDVTRRSTDGAGAADAEELQQALRPDRWIPLDGKVAAVAATLPEGEDALSTGRLLFDHTLERMRYDEPAGGDWGRGDAEWACDSRFGNCTDYHSYFIGLARSKGLPARFEIGFAVPAGDEPDLAVAGYHCWAWFFAEGHGWVPLDIYQADQRPERAELCFDHLDADRVTFSGGRDLEVEPPPARGPLNFAVTPFAEVDGREADVQFEFRRLLPGPP